MSKGRPYRFVKHQGIHRKLGGHCSRCGTWLASSQPSNMPDHMETGKEYTALITCPECEKDGHWDVGATVRFRLYAIVYQLEEKSE